MAAPYRTDWPDGRLNELAKRLERAATKDEIAALRREASERDERLNGNVNALRGEVRTLTGDPITEGRQKRNAIVVSLVGILAGTGVSSILYFLSGASPH